VLAAVGVLGFVTPGYFLVRVFDPVAVQNGVQGVLTNDYGIAGVDRVICTDGNKVTVGTTFDCKATVNGQPVTVTVRVTSNEGNYEVERPPAT
jgi:hypothetical protein